MMEQRSWGEECGVFAAVGVPRAAEVVRLGLHALQHRGQESSGIVSCDPQGELHSHRGLGLVSDIYGEAEMHRLPGQLAHAARFAESRNDLAAIRANDANRLGPVGHGNRDGFA